MLYARVKSDNIVKATTACGGLTFVKEEYRPVPAHEEASALANPILETTTKPPKPAPKKSAAPTATRNGTGTVKLVTKVPESSPDFAPVSVEEESK